MKIILQRGKNEVLLYAQFLQSNFKYKLNENSSFMKYSSLRDGSVVGVAVSREQMLVHSQTLNVACKYSESEYVVCVLDYKREFGLWHGIHSVFNYLLN